MQLECSPYSSEPSGFLGSAVEILQTLILNLFLNFTRIKK